MWSGCRGKEREETNIFSPWSIHWIFIAIYWHVMFHEILYLDKNCNKVKQGCESSDFNLISDIFCSSQNPFFRLFLTDALTPLLKLVLYRCGAKFEQTVKLGDQPFFVNNAFPPPPPHPSFNRTWHQPWFCTYIISCLLHCCLKLLYKDLY